MRFSDNETLVGRAALRGRLEWDSVLSANMELDGVTSTGNTVEIRRVVERSDAFAALGLDEVIREDTEIVLDSEGIQTVVFGSLEKVSRERLESALGDFLPWAQHDYPERVGRIRPDGFDYQARRARDWLSLLNEWRRGVR
jgi:hypothetical protein